MKRVFNFSLKVFGALFLILLLAGFGCYKYLFDHEYKYYPVKDPLVKARLDDWQDRKLGLMMHWGPYSQWGVVESWSICSEDVGWTKRKSDNYVQYVRDYEALKNTFNPMKFDPDRWARAAADAGMKYLVFTTKHHDGFCMFDTKTTDYKITSPGCAFGSDPRANVTKGIFDAFREKGFMIGAYFSKPDWHSTDYWWRNFATPDENVNYKIEKYPERWQRFVQYTHTQIEELMTNYGRVDLLWLDGGWVRPLTPVEATASSWVDDLFSSFGYTQLHVPQSQDLDMAGMAKMARQHQPGLIVVDRWVESRQENYLTPENRIPEKYDPNPWESCLTMGGGWSYTQDAQYRPARELVHSLIDIASKGGNMLLNIGPGPDGTWQVDAYERLKKLGEWMKVNGPAIYATRGMEHFQDGKWSFTQNKDGSINAIYRADKDERQPPATLTLPMKVSGDASIEMLGAANVTFERKGSNTIIILKKKTVQNPPCAYAWSFHISNKK